MSIYAVRCSPICLALMLAAAPAPARTDDMSDLSRALDQTRQRHGISAAAYFIVDGNRILALEAFGHLGHDRREAFTADNRIRIGSITKTVTSLTTMTLVERGVIRLSAPLRSLVSPPRFDNPWADSHPVRVAHLLEHTAGLAGLSKREFDSNEPLAPEQAFAVDPASRRLRWPPGRFPSYSNSGAGILSHALATVTGTSFTSLVAREILEPLGMASARFELTDAERAALVTGYDTDGHTPIPYWHTLYPAFGGLNVSPRDMVAIVQLFLNRGRYRGIRILDECSVERIETPRTSLAARARLTYGYGLGIYEYQHRGVSFFGHGGDADGYLSHFGYSNELGRGYFVVINAFQKRTLRAMRRQIEDAIIGEHAVAAPLPAQLAREHAERLTGRYHAATRRFGPVDTAPVFEVFRQGRGLATRIANGNERMLVPVTPWLFRREDETRATIAFIPCDGKLYVQGDFGNFIKSDERSAGEPCEAR